MPRKYTKKNRGSCDMIYKSSYRTPCHSLPLDAKFAIRGGQMGGYQSQINGYNTPDFVEPSNGCVSYNVDVNAPQVAGRAIITGNPAGCLDNQMSHHSTFDPVTKQVGGGASCTGVGFDLSKSIGGQPIRQNYSPNCLFGETVSSPRAVLSGGRRKKNKPKKKKRGLSKKENKILKDAIKNHCKKRKIKCSKKMKDKLYDIVIDKLCPK
jgi:hypothetical protein